MSRPPKIAFVGSGGAARGLAHLGVLRALEEHGIKPSIFVGASAGAIVASTYGQGIPLDVLLDPYRLPWKRRHEGPKMYARTFFGAPSFEQVLDPGYLLSGLFSIDKLERHLAHHLPVNDFRRLPCQVLVTAVDVDAAQRKVFGTPYDVTTPISQAVAASCCVPGLFRPYRIGSRYYLDGEVARTLSADLAVEAGADVVIISNIYRPALTREGRPSIARRGGLKVLNQTLNILLTAKERTGIELLQSRFPGVTFIDIAPNIGMFGYLNRYAARSLVLRGYRSALRALGDAKERGVFDPTPRMRLVGGLN
jgi:NTE family protein